MAATTNNFDLTRAFQQMQAQITDLDARLKANIPKVEEDVANVVTDVKMMFDALKADLKPEIDRVPLIIEAMKNTQEQVAAEKQRMKAAQDMVFELRNGRKEADDKIAKITKDFNVLRDTMQNDVQQVSIESQAKVGQDVKIDVSSGKH